MMAAAYRYALSAFFIITTVGLLLSCGRGPALDNHPALSDANWDDTELIGDDISEESVGPPPLEELDGIFADASKGVRQGEQVVSFGADYEPDASGTTSEQEQSIETEDTSLNLRAYEPGEYTYAVFGQEVGDGVLGGGRDDDIPLFTLFEVGPSTYGGGRDDDIPLLYFIGLADYSVGSWRWFGPFGDSDLGLEIYGEEMLSRYKSPNDMYYMTVLVSSGEKATASLPTEGVVGTLPFPADGKFASQAEENPFGVRIDRLITDVDSGYGTEPASVTGVSAVADAGGITVTWDANPDPHVFMYHVYRKEVGTPDPPIALADVDAPATEYRDNTTVAGTVYRYAVRALNDTGVGGFGFALAGYQTPPAIAHITPTVGSEGSEVRFTPIVFGEGPFTYAWNFYGDLAPAASTDARPLVTLGDIGMRTVTLTVTNAYGSDFYGFNIRVLSSEPQWRTFALAMDGDVGPASSMALIDGKPAVVCSDTTNGAVQFIRASDQWGISWNSPRPIDATTSAGHISLSVVNGMPAVGYLTSSFNGELKYVMGELSDGNAWGSPVSIGSFSDLSLGVSLREVDGRPAMSFQGGSYLKFVRANDANGTSWGSPVTVDSTWLSGAFNSMALVGGKPSVAYYMAGLRFVQADDAQGISWGDFVAADDGESKGNYASLMAVLGGFPAVSYYEETSSDPPQGRLMFVRASDREGANWGSPTVVDDGAGGEVGSGTSMAYIGGRPAIAYMDWTHRSLLFVRALDARGDSWGGPVLVDGSGHLGVTVTLIEASGLPAICYADTYGFDIKYAVFY